MEMNKSNSSISEIFIKKKNAVFFKFHFKSSIYAYAKPFIHFQGGWGGVLICIFYSSVSVESGPITAPSYSQCQRVDHSNRVDQTD